MFVSRVLYFSLPGTLRLGSAALFRNVSSVKDEGMRMADDISSNGKNL
jgi:hypothetical protein